MLPLQHLKRRNLGNSQSPAKRTKPENQSTFRRKIFSLTQDSLKSEVFDILYYQKNIIQTKLRLTRDENQHILNKIGYYDPEIENWIESEIEQMLRILNDEMLCVLRNHFREQVYSKLTIKHCTNVFKFQDYKNSLNHSQTGIVQTTNGFRNTFHPPIFPKPQPQFVSVQKTSTPYSSFTHLPHLQVAGKSLMF